MQEAGWILIWGSLHQPKTLLFSLSRHYCRQWLFLHYNSNSCASISINASGSLGRIWEKWKSKETRGIHALPGHESPFGIVHISYGRASMEGENRQDISLLRRKGGINEKYVVKWNADMWEKWWCDNILKTLMRNIILSTPEKNICSGSG